MCNVQVISDVYKLAWDSRGPDDYSADMSVLDPMKLKLNEIKVAQKGCISLRAAVICVLEWFCILTTRSKVFSMGPEV